MTISISQVRAEHYPLALGISHPCPRLSWQLSGDASNWKQRQYTIGITRNGEEEQFYEVQSSESVLVPWPSTPMRSRERVQVRVKVLGIDGSESCWSKTAIEAGLLEKEEWIARPVTGEIQDAKSPKRPFRIRRSFTLKDSFQKARIYITALGIYEAYLNGVRIGEAYLAPGWSVYSSETHYQVYDVGPLLRPGKNTLSAWVAEGWYAGRIGFGYEAARNVWGDRIGLCAQLEVDGKLACGTDESWEWSYGAILSSELYDGEKVDSRIDDESWKDGEQEENGSRWSKVDVLEMIEGNLRVTEAPQVKEIEHIKAKQIITSPSGKTIFDFGQNFAGFVRFVSEPPPSGEIILRHAEVLEEGEICVRPLRAAKAMDHITLGGRLQGWNPKFTFHGFRYVEIGGWTNTKVDDLLGVMISSDMEQIGTFSCSHQSLNQLHSNVYYTTRSNTISVPTDCPQRDERLGWTGDIQVFTPTLSYLFDSTGFLKGWLRDLYADQQACAGIVPTVIPRIPNSLVELVLSQAIWGDVAVLCPWDTYIASGDRGVLLDQYASAQMWLDRGVVRDPHTGLWSHSNAQLADWLSPQADPDAPDRGPTDSFLVADAYLIHTTRVAAKIAAVLGLADDQQRYSSDADRLLAIFHETYVTPRHRVISETQTALALLLHFDLTISTSQRETLVRRLGEVVSLDEFQVGTGFAGTPIILQALADNSMLPEAYRMLLARDCPSWLSPILLGATTIWERWDSMLEDGTVNSGEMTSFNHFALGSVAAFLHSYIGGLSPLEPGWKKILVKPQPCANLTWAKTSTKSSYGMVSCEWKIEGGKLIVEVEVPPNCTASIELPGEGTQREVQRSGSKTYVVDFKVDPRFPPPIFQRAFATMIQKEWVQN
ncbi:hypothetical protein V866_007948 [Kwoniella sp. B9012]